MGIIQAIFTALTTTVSSFGGLISSVFDSAVELFYAESGLTVLGTLSLIGVASGLFFFALKWVRGLIKMKG